MPSAYIILAAVFYISCSFAAYNDVYDDMELIKCELRDLKRTNEDLKRSYDDIQKERDLQKAEIAKLKATVSQQKTSFMDVKIQSGKLSTFCRLLPDNICGQCSCLDDSTLSKGYYCDCQHLDPKRDCLEFRDAGNHISGLYRVTMNHLKTTQVYCDQETDDGGWTVIQRRFDGKTKFYKNWLAYKNGFGNRHQEFWIGNDNLYLLTLQGLYPSGSELRIDMEDWEGVNIYAKYSTVVFDNGEKNYKMHVGGYSGSAGDSLGGHSGLQFSTYDRDNDVFNGSCARDYRGAWWYSSCHSSNLNGEYRWYDEEQPGFARGVIWYTHKGHGNSMKSVEMKVRRKT